MLFASGRVHGFQIDPTVGGWPPTDPSEVRGSNERFQIGVGRGENIHFLAHQVFLALFDGPNQRIGHGVVSSRNSQNGHKQDFHGVAPLCVAQTVDRWKVLFENGPICAIIPNFLIKLHFS
jgi:hypothetical protein